MFKLGDMVEITEDTACAYNGWGLSKGMMGEVIEIDDDIITIDCEVADDDCAYVEAKFLKSAKCLGFTEILVQINTVILTKPDECRSFSRVLSEAFEEMQEYKADMDQSEEFDYLSVTPQMLSHVFKMLPLEVQVLAIPNYVLDLSNPDFCDTVRAVFQDSANWKVLESLKKL